MNTMLLAAVVAITFGSRLVALTVLPQPSGALAELTERLPTPLFASLAALSLMNSSAGPTDPALLAAAACALVTTRRASLLATLAAGIAGFVAVQLLL